MSKLDEAFNIEPTPKDVEVVQSKSRDLKNASREIDLKKDYDFVRQNLYDLISMGQEALMDALEVAKNSEHPRAFEVVGQLLKNVADTSDKLMALQKDVKAVTEETPTKVTNNTNNTMFVGSTADLIKALKSSTKISKDEDE
jgi:hypothetical protein